MFTVPLRTVKLLKYSKSGKLIIQIKLFGYVYIFLYVCYSLPTGSTKLAEILLRNLGIPWVTKVKQIRNCLNSTIKIFDTYQARVNGWIEVTMMINGSQASILYVQTEIKQEEFLNLEYNRRMNALIKVRVE